LSEPLAAREQLRFGRRASHISGGSPGRETACQFA
jgi:hypothetical protein